MIAGLGFTAGLVVRPDLSICFAPIVLPLLLAPALAVLSSRRRLGERLARAGLMVTPDEHGSSAMPVVFRPSAKPAQVLQLG